MKVKYSKCLLMPTLFFIILTTYVTHTRTVLAIEEISEHDVWTHPVIQEYISYLKEKSEQGNPKAQFFLGTLYKAGHGMPQDFNEAIYWYEKSAKQGVSESQSNLGSMYFFGQGVAKDHVKAFYWLEKSGDKKSLETLLTIDKAEAVEEAFKDSSTGQRNFEQNIKDEL